MQLSTTNPKSIFITPTNRIEIDKIIRNMKLTNGGVDNVNSKTLKVLASYITVPMVHIFNLCIELSIWPNS